MHRRARFLLVPALISLLLAGCGGGDSDQTAATGGATLTVGSFGFSESETLAQIYGGALAKSGVKVAYRLKIGNREVVGPALQKGEIDMVPEYLGNYLAFLDKTQTEAVPVGQAVQLAKEKAAALGVTVLEPSEAADGDVIAVTKAFAKDNALTKISDLTKLGRPVKLAGPSECATRQTCKLGLEQTYGLRIEFVSTADDAGGPVTKKALKDKNVDVARLFSSDPDIGGDFVVLQDDKGFQQAGNVIPVVRTAKLTPAIKDVFDRVSRSLTTEELIELNDQTDVKKVDPADAAKGWLTRNGF